MQRAKNDKIAKLEEQVKDFKQQLKSFDDLKRQNGELIEKLSKVTKEVRELRMQKKEMSKTFHKELSGIKTQQVAAMRHSNEKYLNTANMIQVSFYDTL